MTKTATTKMTTVPKLPSKRRRAERSIARKFEAWVEAFPNGAIGDLMNTLRELLKECDQLSGYEPDWVADSFGIADATPEQWEQFFDETGASGEMCQYLQEFSTIDTFDIVAESIHEDMDDLKRLRAKYGSSYLIAEFKPEWPVITAQDAVA